MSQAARSNAAPIEGDALRLLEDSILPDYVAARRWYGAKNAGTPRVQVVDAIPLTLASGAAQLCILRVEPPGQPAQSYLLPLILGRGDEAAGEDPFLIAVDGGVRWAGALRDGFGDEGLVRALIDGMREGRTEGPLVFGRTDAFPEIGADAPLRWAGVEQSNTSVRVGDAAIIKGFRKLEPGLHPELEVTRFLTEVARYPNTPPLLGWVERRGERGPGTVLCVMQGLVPGADDAWGHVTGRLAARVTTFKDTDREEDERLLALMRLLGRRTAELHRALATPTEDAAFRPEPVDDGTLREWADAVRRMAANVIGALREAAPKLEDALAVQAASLIACETTIEAQIEALTPTGLPLTRTRLHGDFHLGQVLVAGDDVHIIDFEGEPMRPLDERRAKHSPLRDVAGMLRSIAYAAATARKSLPEGMDEADRAARESWIAWWEAEANTAFVGGYRDAIGDCPSFPEDTVAATCLLKLFLLEKALYEVGYELANRPDWLPIPLSGVLGILGADAGPDVADHVTGAPDRVPPTGGRGYEGPSAAGLMSREDREERRGPLDLLAERMGIEAEYINAAGEPVRASPDTVRALLAAMGVEAPDEAAARERLEELRRAELSRPLPPVAVLRTDRPPFGVPVTLPTGSGELRWTLAEESGGERTGTMPFTDLPLLDRAAQDGKEMEVRRLDLGPAAAAGYHRLRIEAGGTVAETMVIAAPDRCHLPVPIEAGAAVWGLSAQLFSLRSARDWGIGDFGDLASLADVAAARGAAVVGLNPLHALFLDRPDQASPYSPASRLFLNPLYIDVTALPELVASEEARARIASDEFLALRAHARDEALVDYDAVARLKLPVLEMLFGSFRSAASEERRSAFDAFRRELGESLERFCTFQALRERFAAEGNADWRRWPEEFHRPDSDAVARFAAENRERIDFLAWLQWIADSQLATAAERARARGMAVGFYRDLAVGADSGGAETWAAPQIVVASAHVGAPPDLFNPAGQDWGLPPFHPRALREDGYAGFIELVRANMRHAGALRIDHAMALQHVYWIPEGRPASEGAYVAYPMEDLLGILALESVRHRCLVVGEDLGTVPEGFRERMTEAGVLSYRVVFFEWTDDGGFVGPDAYPYLALATVGSHDLATLRGWWQEHDITLKEKIGLYPAEGEAERQRARRRDERARLIDALRGSGIPLPASFGSDSPYDGTLSHAMHAFLARTNSAIAMVQLDELTDEAEQVNLPGTVDQYPNWRRKLSLTLEEIADDLPASALAAIMAAARPAPTEDKP